MIAQITYIAHRIPHSYRDGAGRWQCEYRDVEWTHTDPDAIGLFLRLLPSLAETPLPYYWQEMGITILELENE